jgi:hypothetical protein
VADCPDICGDSYCSASETFCTCPGDCAAACGDGCCTGTEDSCNCPADCSESCGDGCCSASEHFGNCPGDCPDDCGDTYCSASEDYCTCSDDCPNVCGDNCCSITETYCTCPTDCSIACGDGCCSAGEDICSCPADCSTPCPNYYDCFGGSCTYCDTDTMCEINCIDCGTDHCLDHGSWTECVQCIDNSHSSADEFCDADYTCQPLPTCPVLCTSASLCSIMSGVELPGYYCPIDSDICCHACGDGYCYGTETSSTCPADCGDVCGVFGDDFEDGDYDGWLNGIGSYTREVTSATAANGTTYSLHLVGGGSHNNGMYYNLGSVTPSTVSYWARSPSTAAHDAYVVLQGPGKVSSLDVVAFIYFTATGVISHAGTTCNTYAYSANTWYHLELRNMNYSAHTYDFYVNDSLACSNVNFRSASNNAIGRIDVYNFTVSQGWWDEFCFN